MSSDSDERVNRLLAEARAVRLDTSAREMNFETRLMARIREKRRAGRPWFVLAWRMIPAFAVIAAIIGVYTVTYKPAGSDDLFAAITYGHEEYIVANVLTGDN